MEWKIGTVRVQSPLALAPMAGYTDMPLRVCLRALGGLGMGVTELVNARSLLALNPKALHLMATCSEDKPLGVQLFGGLAEDMRDAARFLERCGADWIDINMGCPAPKVHRCGGGATLMKDEKRGEEIVRAVVQAVSIPVTVKMRLGWDNLSAHLLAPRLEAMGVAAIAVHGRTRQQGYSGKADWEGVRAVVQSVKIPVIGNSDVRTPQDVSRMIHETGCAAVMAGRVVLHDPFFFRRADHFLKTGEMLPMESWEEKAALMHRYFFASVRFHGEKTACLRFRKIIAVYSRGFPEKEKWREGMRHLNSVEDYLAIVRRLAPQTLEECVQNYS
ncbi:MAG: tRNA dihydrouridine synthase DusB [bacterium]